VETVAWISELKGELSMMFGLLGLWWHCRSANRVLTAAFFIAAMLSKPSAIVFPGVVLLVERIILGNSLRKSAVLPALYSLLLLPLALVTKRLQPDFNLDFVPTVAQRFSVAADALTFYVCKVLVPFPLALDYGRSPQYVLTHVPGWQLALSAIFLMGGLTVLAKAPFRPSPATPVGGWRSLVTCGWSIFVLSTAPVLGLIPFEFQDFSTVADHYLYVSIMGVSLMVAGIMVRLGTAANSRRVAAAALVVLACLSFQQARLWRSTFTIFAHTVKVNPRSYLGTYSIAEEHLRAGRFDESIEWSSKSLAINPNYPNATIALGLAWAQKGDLVKAIDEYSLALARNPSIVGTRARPVASIHNNLGMVLLRVGRKAEGVEHFRKAVEIFPLSTNAHLNLGNVAFDDQRYLDAIAEYKIAQAISPGIPAVELRLARAQSTYQALLDHNARPASP
jgi:protein O-mannosyl-transferase